MTMNKGSFCDYEHWNNGGVVVKTTNDDSLVVIGTGYLKHKVGQGHHQGCKGQLKIDSSRSF